MARVITVKKARKDYPAYGIKKGETYYHWSFKNGGKYKSKSYPRRSQLTRSEFYGQLYDIEDAIGALSADESLADEVNSIASDLRSLGEECADRLSNMPDSLQYSSTGELLQERADECESKADELENIASEIDVDSKEEDESEEDYYERMLQEVQDIDLSIN